jgi:hypothetical protein
MAGTSCSPQEMLSADYFSTPAGDCTQTLVAASMSVMRCFANQVDSREGQTDGIPAAGANGEV